MRSRRARACVGEEAPPAPGAASRLGWTATSCSAGVAQWLPAPPRLAPQVLGTEGGIGGGGLAMFMKPSLGSALRPRPSRSACGGEPVGEGSAEVRVAAVHSASEGSPPGKPAMLRRRGSSGMASRGNAAGLGPCSI